MPTNGPITFFDIPVDDAGKARSFWGDLFGWTFAADGFPGYEMIDGSTPRAGLDATSGAGPIRVYFEVDDIVAASAVVRDLGGEAGEPWTLPSGTLARCADDQGTAFTLWQSAGA